jgi:hypothetical protein
MDAERCRICDRPKDATTFANGFDFWELRDGYCRRHLHGAGAADCTDHAVDWRERAMVAEADRDEARKLVRLFVKCDIGEADLRHAVEAWDREEG